MRIVFFCFFIVSHELHTLYVSNTNCCWQTERCQDNEKQSNQAKDREGGRKECGSEFMCRKIDLKIVAIQCFVKALSLSLPHSLSHTHTNVRSLRSSGKTERWYGVHMLICFTISLTKWVETGSDSSPKLGGTFQALSLSHTSSLFQFS